jgi:epoxyqueuosine reductase
VHFGVQTGGRGTKLKLQGKARRNVSQQRLDANDFAPECPLVNTKSSYVNGGAAGSMPNDSAQPGEAVERRLRPERVRALALAAGFHEAGVVSLPYADEGRDARRLAEWIGAGRGGAMQYLARRDDQGRLLRTGVRIPFPWARSAVVCFASYNSALPRSVDAHAAGAGWIARYAWSSRVDANAARRPSDYHKVLKKRLDALQAALRAESGVKAGAATGERDFEARGFVDTGPVLERALATAAGIGWTGKNTCLIHPKLGSFGFLAVLLTSLPLEEGKAPTALPDRCGSCRRCIDLCPTGALIAPRQMDATRCISYLTIELKGAIDESLLSGMGRQVFGCDICQDVCPWNRKAMIAADPALEPRAELVNPLLEWLGGLSEAEFEKQFNGSPVRRASYAGLLRNVAVAMGNCGLKRSKERLALWADAPDEGLRRAALWALRRLGG